jgi:hypothetical protein
MNIGKVGLFCVHFYTHHFVALSLRVIRLFLFLMIGVYVLSSNEINMNIYVLNMPVTVAERSKACTVLARSEPGIVDLNPTQGMDV